jgi:predicted acyltransferase
VEAGITKSASPGRLVSLDALRGFDMFWIIGGGATLQKMIEASKNVFFTEKILPHFSHVGWVGFHGWDLIMPLFLFMVGAALPFSYGKRVERGDSKAAIYKHAIKRVLILSIFGLMVQGNLLDFDLNRLVFHLNTLHAIAAGYFVATVLMLHFNIRQQAIITAGLLLVFWAILVLIPVPRHQIIEQQGQKPVWVSVDGSISGRESLTRQDNLAIWLDHAVYEKLGLLPFWDAKTGDMRPLSVFGFGANVMLGVFAGYVLRLGRRAGTKFSWLAGLGIVLLGLGWAWGLGFPIIKRLWTSSFVLYACGWSFLLLAIFYWVIDVWGFKKWSYGFVVIGMNAIAAYMAAELSDFSRISDVALHGLYRFAGDWAEAVRAMGGFVTLWLILWWMYRKKTFLKI